MILLIRLTCGCGAALLLQAWHAAGDDHVRYLSTGPSCEAVEHCPRCGVHLGLDVVRREGAGNG
jgi:hypothetical protein